MAATCPRHDSTRPIEMRPVDFRHSATCQTTSFCDLSLAFLPHARYNWDMEEDEFLTAVGDLRDLLHDIPEWRLPAADWPDVWEALRAAKPAVQEALRAARRR